MDMHSREIRWLFVWVIGMLFLTWVALAQPVLPRLYTFVLDGKMPIPAAGQN
jgi:hypothetical protein